MFKQLEYSKILFENSLLKSKFMTFRFGIDQDQRNDRVVNDMKINSWKSVHTYFEIRLSYL